ncbi:MAG: orotidine-5'-phosphate decarboxylase [Deltaproteobacteria bacterium]|nr:orotidine-5'-phosphate decarboxylase [Deltaproteobacteria bacterium]
MTRTAKHQEQLIVALDGTSLDQAQELVELLREDVKNFEVGMELFTAAGPAVVEMIRRCGCHAFLDLKYHDIPSTVAKAIVAAAELGVTMINLHASGGQRMMEESLHALERTMGPKRPKLVAVTVLTSLETLGDIGVQYEVREQVVRLAQMAKEAGLDGVTASPMEIHSIRRACGKDFLIVTPGIRLIGEEAYDQRRIGSPRQAIESGADYLVVGRPITEARDPRTVVHAFIAEIKAIS